MSRAHPEQDLQQAVVQYLDAVLVDAWYTHFPAGGGGRMRGAFLKSMGLKPGVPDIEIITNEGRVFWLELKSSQGRVSDAQRTTHTELLGRGCGIAIARDLAGVRTALRMWGIPTREASS